MDSNRAESKMALDITPFSPYSEPITLSFIVRPSSLGFHESLTKPIFPSEQSLCIIRYQFFTVIAGSRMWISSFLEPV